MGGKTNGVILPSVTPLRSTSSSAANRVAEHYRSARAWFRAVQTRDLSTIDSRLERFGLKTVQVVSLVGRLDVINRLQLHAQSLTYDTLLALVPLLAVVFATVSGFGGLEELRRRLEELIVSNISASDEVRAAVAEYLHRFLSNIRTGRFSAISVIILIFSVLSLLGHIESAFNAVFGSKTGRPWVSRLLTYWAALTLGPLLLGVSFALTAALQTSWVAAFIESLGLGGALVRLLPLLVTWIAFAAMYLVIPNARVRFSAAIFAALVAGSLWNVARSLYAIYARNNVTVQNIYGSLAAIPLFILWIYVSWLLVLLGAQLAFAFQNASTYAKEGLGLHANQAYRERVACRAFLEIARDFFCGRPPTDPDTIAADLGIPRRLLENTTSDLRMGGFLREVEGQGLVPAKDLAKVTVADIVGLLRKGLGVQIEMTDDEGRRLVDAILDKVDRELEQQAGAVTFRDLVARMETATPASAGPAAQVDSHAGTRKESTAR